MRNLNLSLVPVLALVGFLAGCHRQLDTAASVPALPTAAVHVQTAERRAVAAVEDVVGTVRPKLSALIEAKVTGRIGEMLVAPGQGVTNGEPLIQLDAREVQARYDQASAARQQAESDLKRFTTLLDQKILSPAEYDAARSKYRVAEAVETEALTMLDYTHILAPFDGVVVRKLADVGDLATPGKTLLQVENPNALRLEADVPEALIGNVKVGDKLPVNVATVPANIEGTVVELSPAADATSRTFLVKLDLPGAQGLRSGQFGRVAVPVGIAESIHVPAAAVVQRGQMEMVFVAANNHAQLRLVKTGRHAADGVEIVSGLDAGETIVTEGAAALVDGQPLKVTP